MNRYLSEFIKKDLDKKLVLLAGPRQVGKTWLSKELFTADKSVYLNFDRAADRTVIRQESWRRDADLVILDEIHKLRDWKSWIKGIYDTEAVRPRLLLTGSARLDMTRRGGTESLAGRHHLYRLHPLSVKEVSASYDCKTALSLLLKRGGFPEPFFAATDVDADRWRLTHLDSMLREDLRDIVVIQDIKSLEYLVERLAAQVGSPVSYQSLAEDVGVSAPTIKRWIATLESIYVIFTVQPWTRKIKGSLLKQPKVYFFDTARIPEHLEAARFENLVACALLKHQQFLEDTKGIRGGIFYLRNKRGAEVDFLVVEKNQPAMLVECKLSESDDPNFDVFSGAGSRQKPVLLTRNECRELSHKTWDLKNAAQWLATLEA
jgi:predicted AAA+ superfamily ATPase